MLVGALVLAVVLFIRRPRGKTPMDRAIYEVEDAMRRVGRPVTTGTTLIQLERRLGSHSPEVSAYLRALAPAATGRPRTHRRGPAAAHCGELWPRASASAAGCARLWALPPRYERGEREPRSRDDSTCEMTVRS